MKNTNNIDESIKYDNLEFDIKNKVILFKNILNNLDSTDLLLKNLGYEIVDSKILLDLIKSCFKNKKKSQLNVYLEDLLSKEVNRYSEFEKYLRMKEYNILYDIDYSFDANNNLSTVTLNKDKNGSTNLKEFLDSTKLFRNIIGNKIFDKNSKINSTNKVLDINIDIKEIFKELLNVSVDDEHYKELSEIINLRKRIVYLSTIINSCKIISNLDIEELVLRDDIKNLFYLFAAECSNNLVSYQKELNSSISKIRSLVDLYNSKKMDIEEESTYDIYSDIVISDEDRKLINYYYDIYKSTNNEKNISFLNYLRINYSNEKNIIKIVEALVEQFNTIYSDYLIYKTPYANTDLCITFEQFAKKMYGISNVSKKF